jgi:hypothetical protein
MNAASMPVYRPLAIMSAGRGQNPGLFSFHLLRHKKYAMTAKMTINSSRTSCVVLMAVRVDGDAAKYTHHPLPAPNKRAHLRAGARISLGPGSGGPLLR